MLPSLVKKGRVKSNFLIFGEKTLREKGVAFSNAKEKEKPFFAPQG